MNVCSVKFPGKDVNREEFFNLISASVELMLMSDTKWALTRSEMQLYEVKSDRIAKARTKLVLSIMSQSDGTLTSAILQEMPWFGSRASPRPPTAGLAFAYRPRMLWLARD
jgi:hypothetical protein